MLKTKKGQSTVEYVILVAVVIGVIFLFLTPDNSPFRSALNSTLNDAKEGMLDMSTRLRDSRGDNPTSNGSGT